VNIKPSILQCRCQENSIHTEGIKPAAPFYGVTGFYYAPAEQKSWKIFQKIFVACRLRNISGSKSM